MPVTNQSSDLIAAIVAAVRDYDGQIWESGNQRIYSGMAPQNGELPRIIIHEITQADEYGHDSATASDPGVSESTIQFDCEAISITDARALADDMANLFGGAIIQTSGQASIQASFRDGSGFSQPLDLDTGNGDFEAWRHSIDFRFLWKSS